MIAVHAATVRYQTYPIITSDDVKSGAPLTITGLTLSLMGAAETTMPRINQFAAFRCGHVAAEIDAAWAASPHAVASPNNIVVIV